MEIGIGGCRIHKIVRIVGLERDTARAGGRGVRRNIRFLSINVGETGYILSYNYITII